MSDIRQRAYLAWLTLFLGCCAMGVEAQVETEFLRDALSKPIKIERDEVVTSMPLQIRSGMLHLTASINDFTGEFVFDTGSPTVIDQTIAEKLNLKILDNNNYFSSVTIGWQLRGRRKSLEDRGSADTNGRDSLRYLSCSFKS